MIVCSIDFETTGVNIVSDRPIEYGGVLYSTKQHRMLDAQSMLVKTDISISPEITQVTGIIKPMLDKFGYDSGDVFPLITQMMETADAMIGYNCRRFDREVLNEWFKREGQTMPDKTWIDLFYDLPWNVPTGKLSHVAADHGILNLFPHSALADCQTVLAIAAKYDDNLLLERAKSPVVVLRAVTHDRSHNQAIKQAKFRWNPSFRLWWKPVKEQDMKQVVETLSFPTVIDDRTPEELED